MKQIFFDQDKSTVIKVFSGSGFLEREICGAKNFAPFVQVPQITKLDNKVAKISLLSGFLGYQISEDDLNLMVAKMLVSVRPKIGQYFSIVEEIDALIKFFIDDKNRVRELKRIKNRVESVKLVPVHGDLQKQNIIISDGKLGLIDFEHFMFAPKELELCNSLFFSDGNCLNVQKIIKLLPKGFIDKQMLKLMLKFYELRQISLERINNG